MSEHDDAHGAPIDGVGEQQVSEHAGQRPQLIGLILVHGLVHLHELPLEELLVHREQIAVSLAKQPVEPQISAFLKATL